MSKKTKKTKRDVEPVVNGLPQNIVTMGERVLDDRNIYIHQSAYKAIARFTKGKTTNESGGVLVGSSIAELGKTNIMITGFIEAKHAESTPTTLKFTHETWQYCHGEMEKRFKGETIVGWIHTHPDFGVFLSEYDKFIQKNFFSEDYQVAYVVDPVQRSEGFFYWVNGDIERCPGFYIYDEVGKRIALPTEPAADSASSAVSWGGFVTATNIAVAGVALAVFFLFMGVNAMTARIERLQDENRMLLARVQKLENWAARLVLVPAPSTPADVPPTPEVTATPKP